jgi:hypothetical protein
MVDEITDREMLDVGPPTPPDTVEGKREDVRRVIVQNLTYAVIGIPVISVITVAVMPDRLTTLKEILPLIFTGLFGAYGTAIGFYFGERK